MQAAPAIKNLTLASAPEADDATVARAITALSGDTHIAGPAMNEAHVPNEPTVRWTDDIDWSGLARSWAARLMSLAGGLLIWHFACVYKFQFFIKFENVPAPLVVLMALVKQAHETKFYIHIMVSMERILISFSLATFVGIFLGVLMGRSKLVRVLVVPYIEILRPIPAVAWIPLAILMWPTENRQLSTSHSSAPCFRSCSIPCTASSRRPRCWCARRNRLVRLRWTSSGTL